MGDDTVHRALQFPHVGGDLVRQELQDLAGNGRAQLLRLGLQDSETQLVRGRMDVGDEAPAEA
jgi:hypothetical protein